ncbi:MAG: dTDP-4-dehydrorhamnose reductase [Candidatus Spechtbacterales bacterium]
MKIVILGAKGMLGRDLGRVFYDLNPYLLDKDELDIRDKEGIFALFRNLKPDVVINAAAYTDVDGCETNKELAMQVNGAAPGYLAAAAKDVGAVFAHYSTDYVFDGKKIEGYSEDDKSGNPLNFYGETKLVGENAVREAGGEYYLIRTSWLYGINGKNFVETMLRLAKEKKDLPAGRQELRVVNDQHGKPTFSLDLARKTRELIENKKDFGIYHIINEPKTTWYDFASEILGQGGQAPRVITPCASAEFPRPAKRPQYSILLNTKLPPLRAWQEALAEYLALRK